MKTRQLVCATVAAALAWAAAPAAAGELPPAPPYVPDRVPAWQKLLRWSGGESSETPVPTAMMGPHMQMSVRRAERPGDAARAAAVLAAARRVLERYRDVEVAERDGYIAFLPRGIVGEEVHYTNYWKAGREANTFDLEQPGTILYKRTPAGMVAVGVMYVARKEATPQQLDARLPLSHAVWHRHVHFCGWPEGAPRHEWDGPRARFGIAGSIHTEPACRQAGGYWIPLVLGWMAHVYPHETEADKIWIGEQMMDAHVGHDGGPSQGGHGGHAGHKH